MSVFHETSYYLICKCFFLSGLLLVSVIILSVWTSACPVSSIHLRHYISFAQTSSLTILSTGLLGGLFLEDILRKTQ